MEIKENGQAIEAGMARPSAASLLHIQTVLEIESIHKCTYFIIILASRFHYAAYGYYTVDGIRSCTIL